MLVSRSPWDGVILGEFPEDADPAGAFARIRAPSRGEARTGLERLAQVLVAHRQEAIDLLVREAGKVVADAAAEADLLPRKIATVLGPGLASVPDGIPDTAGVRWIPRGPAVVLGPFNFPLHLLHGLVVPALAVGCPVVAKPSERTPALGAWYRDRLDEAGLSPFVQVVQGGPTTAAILVDHPAVATVAAVGSRTMGVALARRLAERPEVVLALELGGVNHVLIRDDADLAVAAAAVADGAWKMAGQRCTATRIVHVSRGRSREFFDILADLRDHWTPTGQHTSPAGPMIDGDTRRRILAPFTDLPRGWRILGGDPTACPAGPASADPLLVLAGDRQDLRYHTEHFGPVLLVDLHDHEREALTAMRTNSHRLSAGIWTADRTAFAQLADELPYGLISHNQNTAGARGDLPFGGCGLSGNGHPAGLCATRIFADETAIW